MPKKQKPEFIQPQWKSVETLTQSGMIKENLAHHLMEVIIMKFRRSFLILLSSFCLLAACSANNRTSPENGKQSDASDQDLQEKTASSYKDVSIKDGAIFHAFSWDFDTIRQSLPAIAASGFNTIQTSPINAVLEGENGGMDLYGDGKWYYHYQPVDWTIGNYQLGSLEDFEKLCQEAEEYGISIIVDVAPNHTTPKTEEVSENLIQAAGDSLDDLYHENSKYDMSNFSDRLQLTAYKMGGLPDVNTENEGFQDYFIDFLDQAIEAGADGFRFDTAKHIGLEDDPTEKEGIKNNFWDRVTEFLDKKGIEFSYGEVLQGGKDRIADYIETIGAATASNYGEKIRYAIQLGNLNPGSLSDYSISGAKPDVVTWVESHDNYINDGNWKDMDEDQVLLAYALIGSRKDGTPLFFDRPYQASTKDQWGENRIGVSGSNFYMDPAVRAINYFRQAMIGEDETLVNPDDDSTALLIERGDKGLVIVNLRSELKTGFEVNLKDGEYENWANPEEKFTVKNGKLTSKNPIPADSIVVLSTEPNVIPAAPAVLDVENLEFHTEKQSQKPVLHLQNTESGTWTLKTGDQETSGSFQDGDAIDIDLKDADEASLILEADNKDGIPSWKEFEIVRKQKSIIPKGTSIQFEAPDSWKENIKVYVYSDIASDQNMTWPGTAMEKTGDTWTYTFDQDWEDPLVIFTDGTNQYPAANAPGLKVEDQTVYRIQ